MESLLNAPVIIELVLWAACTVSIYGLLRLKRPFQAPTIKLRSRDNLASAISDASAPAHDSFGLRQRRTPRLNESLDDVTDDASLADVATEPPLQLVQSPISRYKDQGLRLALLIFSGYLATLCCIVALYRWQENFFLYSPAIPCNNVSDPSVNVAKGRHDLRICDYFVDGRDEEHTFIEIDAPTNPVVHVWLIKANAAVLRSDQLNKQMTVFFTHGNCDNIATYKNMYRWLSDQGINVVAWDYPGFGRSSGESVELTIDTAAEAVLKFLVSKGISESKTILWGFSLGGAVVTKLAISRPFGAMVLQAPIDSAAEVLWNALPLTGWAAPLLLTQPYDTKARMPNIKTACLLQFVGEKDTEFSVARQQAVYQAATGINPACSSFLVIPDLGHLDDPLRSPVFRRKTKEFFAKVKQLN